MNANKRKYIHKYALFHATEIERLMSNHKNNHNFFSLHNYLRNFLHPNPVNLTMFIKPVFYLRDAHGCANAASNAGSGCRGAAHLRKYFIKLSRAWPAPTILSKQFVSNLCSKLNQAVFSRIFNQ